MPPAGIPAHVWPVPNMIDDAMFAAGAPVLGVSLFRFGDGDGDGNGEGVGLCICVHHNATDAAGFAEVVKLWVRNIAGAEESPVQSGLDRCDRLSAALSSHLPALSTQSPPALIALHPEHSQTPPQLPTEFAPCTSKLFRITIAKIDTIKAQLRECMPAPPSTNTIVCALVWSSITRARKQRAQGSIHTLSHLAMAVNGRRRLSTTFSPADDPYYGNAVVYSLAKLGFEDLVSTADIPSLARVCDSIAQSQSHTLINDRRIAEIYSLVDGMDDYRTLFPGWDLFNSRDFTITSWADLDLYSMDFGKGLGVPEFIRMPYIEADGVGIVMPRKRGADEVLEVVVMLRRDDMELVRLDTF